MWIFNEVSLDSARFVRVWGEDTTIIKSRMILANVELRMMKNGPRKIRRKWQEQPES